MNDLPMGDRCAILDQIIELTTPDFRQPGDFTINEYVDALNRTTGHTFTTGYADTWLGRLVELGCLEKIHGIYDPETSRRNTVYRWTGRPLPETLDSDEM